MRRRAAVLLSCFMAWSGVARGATPALAATAEPAPATPAASATATPAPGPAPPSASIPGADQIQFAAREHDLGYRAYLDKKYDDAASHFENAFFAAPNPAELRSAIRSRRDAGELARAATLAAIGLRRFPGDPATGQVAAEVIALARPHVFEVQISSPAEYSVAIDEKIVAAEQVKDARLFMNPGTHQLLISWSDERNTRLAIEAREGASESLQLEPPAAPSAVAPPVLPPPPPPTPTAGVPAVVLTPAPPPPAKPFRPAVFVTGAALTAVGLGLTLWSGIDTVNNPGVNAVRTACSSGASDCQSLYDKGTHAQLRTNVFVAATSGLAVLTAAVGVFFTEWGPAPAAGHTAAQGAPSPSVAPVLGIGTAGLEGTF